MFYTLINIRLSDVFVGDALMEHIGCTVSKNSSYPIAVGPPEASMSFVNVHNCAYAHILAMRTMLAERVSEGGKPVADWNGKVAGTAMFVSDFDMNFCDLYQILTSGDRQTLTECGGTVATLSELTSEAALHAVELQLATAGSYRMRISKWFLEFMVYVVEELLESCIYLLFGNTNSISLANRPLYRFLNQYMRQHPVTGLSNGVVESCGQLTCVATSARDMIGYHIDSPNHQASAPVGRKMKGGKTLMKQSPVRLLSKEESVLQTQYFHIHQSFLL
jgi:hypothetical protein